MKTIVVGFSKPRTFKLHAWVIEKVDGAPFDHAYLRFHSESLNRDIIYQSTQKGVEFMGLTLWSQNTAPVFEFPIQVEDANYTSMMQFCVDNCGIDYGLLGVLGAGLVKLASKLRITISNPFDNGLKSEFCSEVVARCLNTVDPAKFNLDAANITPNDLYKIIRDYIP